MKFKVNGYAMYVLNGMQIWHPFYKCLTPSAGEGDTINIF